MTQQQVAIDNGTVQLRPFGVNLRVDFPPGLEMEAANKSQVYLPMCSPYFAIPQAVKVSVKRGEPNLTIDGYKAQFTSNTEDSSMVADALLIASRLVEKALNQNNIFSMHASSISYEGKAVLLVGAYGSGKTTTAINLCMNDKTIGYVTGNRPFLQNSSNKVLYGMGHISVSTSSLVEELHIKRDTLEKIGFNQKSSTPYQAIQASRTHFDASVLDITRADFPLDLKAVILIRKSHRDFVSFMPDVAGEQEVRVLHSALREYSEKNYVLMGPKIILPDIFTEAEKHARLEYAIHVAKSVPILYAEGTLDALSTFVRKLLKEQS